MTPLSPQALQRASRALMMGNFAIGCGVMVATAVLNDLCASLAVSVATGGQLVSVAAVAMAICAPLLAAVVAGFDRRRLLAFALLWFAAGHLASALAPSFAALLPLRALSVLGAAVFTPQAVAAMAVMAPPEQRGRAITLVFLGFSASSVLGVPLAAYIGETLGWRASFAMVAALGGVAAVWVWRAMPDGVRPAALSLADWRGVLTHPALMATVAVTALASAGQFTLFAYFAPYLKQVMGAGPTVISGMFLWFGVFGLLGNIALTRSIDRVGASRAVLWLLGGMALSLLLWPLGLGHVGLLLTVLMPWALGCFASNSAQQARLSQAAPGLASALIALNSSAMYIGQALGAGGGGALIATWGYAPLSWAACAWMLAAMAMSWRWGTRDVRG